MRGRLLILIGLIILLAVIAIVAVTPSLDNTTITISKTNKEPTYDTDVIVFPDGTTDWKTNEYHYYCEIDKQWHICNPVFRKVGEL